MPTPHDSPIPLSIGQAIESKEDSKKPEKQRDSGFKRFHGRPLTPEQRERGTRLSRTPEVRRKAVAAAAKTRMARNALTWLKHVIDNATVIPEPVKTRATKLFADLNRRQNIYTMDEQSAQREADIIATRIHQARAQYVLLTISERDKGYIAASKVAAQWLLIDRKLNSDKGKGRKNGPRGKPVPTAATSHTESEADGSDGEEES